MDKELKGYMVIAMIGSMKFKEEHDRDVKSFILRGHVPIPLVEFGKKVTLEEKQILDVHIRKVIDISDVVYVINKDGYIGESTNSEIHYAENKNIPVYYKYNNDNISFNDFLRDNFNV